LRPYLNRLEVEPYSQDEIRLASMQTDLDGPLIDYSAKGIQIELDGMEKVEDRDCYKLKLNMKEVEHCMCGLMHRAFWRLKLKGYRGGSTGTNIKYKSTFATIGL